VKSRRVVYGTRPPTPKQLADKLAAQCRRALGALKSEPVDRDVKDGEIIVHEPYKTATGVVIGGHYAWETPFEMPVDAFVISVEAYYVKEWTDRRDRHQRNEAIAWAGKILVLPNLDVTIVDVFKKVPAHVRACVERQA
jgi:hypothetical protein